MAEENKDDKTEEASPRKLEQARQKGDVGKSADLPQALSLIGACAVIAFYGDGIALSLVETLRLFLSVPHQLLDSLRGDGGLAITHHVVWKVLPLIGIVMLAALALGVLGHVVQTGFLMAPERLKPSMKKVNPLEGFKRLFGVDALIQFGKTFLKLTAVGFIAWLVLKGRATDMAGLAGASPLMVLPYARDAFMALALAVCLFLLAEGGLDYFLQKFRFRQRQKMSRTEVKDEYRQTEGDPQVKARLRQIRMEKSRQRMIANVPKATVIITNPTHYAVALRYDAADAPTPLCVAKGVDALALKIREVAAEHDVPVVEDPPLARALHATTEVDAFIPEAHYQAVAKIIAFVMSRARRPY